jgi:predicted aspartyl protease
MSKLSKRFDGIAFEIRTSLSVTAPVTGIPDRTAVCEAIWDTGANMSAINLKVARKLGLVATNTAFCDTAGGRVEMPIYLVDLSLPNGDAIPDVLVSGLDLQVCDALIGMDVISKGDFLVTNANDTLFEFRIPSAGSVTLR